MRKWIKTLLGILTLGALGACSSNGEYGKITAEQGKSLMEDNPSIILVDVRTPEEFAEGHIEGAILVPLSELSENADSLLPDKQGIYILYCRSGNRSNQARILLNEMGYDRIYDMGGIIDWPYDTVTG